MKKSIFDTDNDPYLEAARKRRGIKGSGQNIRRRKWSINQNSSGNRIHQFMQQELSTEDFWFIPQEYFGITLFVLFLTLPKILGMSFFFFYVAGGKPELYNHVHSDGYLLDWAIGYEVIAAIALLIIFKKFITYVFAK